MILPGPPVGPPDVDTPWDDGRGQVGRVSKAPTSDAHEAKGSVGSDDAAGQVDGGLASDEVEYGVGSVTGSQIENVRGRLLSDGDDHVRAPLLGQVELLFTWSRRRSPGLPM